MKIENFNRAQEITGIIQRLNKAIQRVECVNTSRGFKIEGGDYGAYIDEDLLDPIAKEMCKTAILSNLQGKVKRLEAEFEAL